MGGIIIDNYIYIYIYIYTPFLNIHKLQKLIYLLKLIPNVIIIGLNLLWDHIVILNKLNEQVIQYTLFTLHLQTMLAQFLKCLYSFSYKCKHKQNHAEATVMRLPYFGMPA